jgi:hypothetical protein
VTECVARPGEVISAKAPSFQLFNLDDIFAVVFFDPSDLSKLAPGQSFAVSIGGIDETVTARVAGFYPELAARPRSLTRYFWQQEKWSQYAPVRLDFDGLSPTQKTKVLAWAQLSASRWQGWSLPASSGRQWIARQLDGLWYFGTSAFAQQPTDR